MLVNPLTGKQISFSGQQVPQPTLSSIMADPNTPRWYGGVAIPNSWPTPLSGGPSSEELSRVDPSIRQTINPFSPQPLIASSSNANPTQSPQNPATMNYQTWLSKYGNNAVNPATGQYWGYQDMMADSGLPESLINVYSAQMRSNYNKANNIPGIAPDNIPNMTDWYRATQAGYDPQALIGSGNGGNAQVAPANTPISLTQLLSGATRFPRNPTIPENGMGLLGRLLNRTGY